MAEYYKRAVELFKNIEDKLDEYEDEIDYETTDGKIQVIFENGESPLVINTQRAIHEIWLAGGAKAWHFKWLDDENQWYAQAEKEEFYQCLAQLIAGRIHQSVSFE